MTTTSRETLSFIQPLDAYLYLINYLNMFGITAVICGGAVRDACMGGKVRDINLYVAIDKFEDAARALWPENWKQQEGHSDSPWTCAQHFQKGDAEYDHQSIHGQFELEHHFGLINLIAVDMHVTVADVISKFNISINQIGIGPNGVNFTAQCYKDITSGTATILRETWGVAGTQNAVRKLRDKYPLLSFQFQDGTEYSDRELSIRSNYGQEQFDLI